MCRHRHAPVHRSPSSTRSSRASSSTMGKSTSTSKTRLSHSGSATRPSRLRKSGLSRPGRGRGVPDGLCPLFKTSGEGPATVPLQDLVRQHRVAALEELTPANADEIDRLDLVDAAEQIAELLGR